MKSTERKSKLEILTKRFMKKYPGWPPGQLAQRMLEDMLSIKIVEDYEYGSPVDTLVAALGEVVARLQKESK
jgi:hypothetical protein